MKPDSEKAKFFVSRRGRQFGVHEIDLSGIDVESEDQQLAPTEKTNERVKKSPQKTKKRAEEASQKSLATTKKPRSTKKRRVLLTVIVLLLILPVVGAELVGAQYQNADSMAKQELNRYANSEVLTAQKQPSVSAATIRGFANKVNEIASKMCRGGLLDNAATLYPRAKTAHDKCKESQRNYSALASGLYRLESEASYLEKVGTLMKPVSTPITDDFAVIDAQFGQWQTASDAAAKLTPPDSMKALHTELASQTKQLAGTWSKLNQANNEQDAASFTESEKAMGPQYEAVRDLGSRYAGHLKEAQTAVSAAYSALIR